jgi:hypothetical protein
MPRFSSVILSIDYKFITAMYTFSSPSIPTIGGGPKVESLSPRERAAERERMVLDIKVKLQVIS